MFAKAEKLVEKFRAKAEAIADEVEPAELRELLYYLVDTVLEKGELRQARQSNARCVELAADAEAGRSPCKPLSPPLAGIPSPLPSRLSLPIRLPPGPRMLTDCPHARPFIRPVPRLTRPAGPPSRSRGRVPQPYHQLLVHTHHMTVTVEEFYRSPVDVRVLGATDGNEYARKILLTLMQPVRSCSSAWCGSTSASAAGGSQRDHRGKTPLGRVLIRHNMLRRIEPVAYLR